MNPFSRNIHFDCRHPEPPASGNQETLIGFSGNEPASSVDVEVSQLHARIWAGARRRLRGCLNTLFSGARLVELAIPSGLFEETRLHDPLYRVFACDPIRSRAKLLFLTRRISTMRHLTLSLLLLISSPLTAGDPQGFACWTAKTLKGFEQKLAPKMDPRMVATEQLATYAGHSLVVVHREGSGEAEVHESLVDIFVVQSGQATLLVGGKVIGGKNTAPGEIRGSGIEGGEKRQLAEGDIVHIPAGMPHQVTLDKGRQLTYVIVKVETK